MALETPCQTPDAIYKTQMYNILGQFMLNIGIEFPFPLNLTEEQAEILEKNIHNALELVLAPHFK
jgi:hypothetical protein